MTTNFVWTPKGYVNLNTVEATRFTKGNRHQTVIDGKLVDECVDFANTITAVIPAQGWECLSICKADEAHPEEVLIDPVIAWGKTVGGKLRPITASEMGGVEGEDYVLRQLGNPRVYSEGSIGGWPNLEAWRAQRAQSHKALEGHFVNQKPRESTT